MPPLGGSEESGLQDILPQHPDGLGFKEIEGGGLGASHRIFEA